MLTENHMEDGVYCPAFKTLDEYTAFWGGIIIAMCVTHSLIEFVAGLPGWVVKIKLPEY